MGNYKGFGDCKFVPNLIEDKMEKLVLASQAAKLDPKLVDLWRKVKGPLYSLSDREKQLGLGEKGVTKYFTSNCDSADSDAINQYLKHKNIEGYITRVIKTVVDGRTVYDIRHAGVEEKLISEEKFSGNTFKVTTGRCTNIYFNSVGRILQLIVFINLSCPDFIFHI